MIHPQLQTLVVVLYGSDLSVTRQRLQLAAVPGRSRATYLSAISPLATVRGSLYSNSFAYGHFHKIFPFRWAPIILGRYHHDLDELIEPSVMPSCP